MYFSLISSFALVVIIADLSNAVPVSTTIVARNAEPETAVKRSLIDLDNSINAPVDVDLSSLCLGVAVCNPVSVVKGSSN
ncbi:hypothetical protein SBOR_7491 [Sclerotinia borealis F-4128]|uniref:Hydrophobin n=1 Tax=Sclerotinia borealis (strain F-4128) TaxID=1432307 RepID=W9C5S6_SCLBF|nr:hypothetical protein SBOR_7491 [Sclerotinia borealis F-4128]